MSDREKWNFHSCEMPISQKKSRFENWDSRFAVVFGDCAENQKRGYFDFMGFLNFFFEMGVELITGIENGIAFFARFIFG